MFYDIGFEDDFDEIWGNIQNKYQDILSIISNDHSKGEHIKQLIQNGLDYLVVPEYLIETWQEEFRKQNLSNTRIVSFKHLKSEVLPNSAEKSICFLSFYGKGLLNKIMHTHHQIHFILFEGEYDLYQQAIESYNTETKRYLQHEHRKEISGIEYQEEILPETPNQLIERLFNDKTEIDFENPDNIIHVSANDIYKITCLNQANNLTEILELSPTKTVVQILDSEKEVKEKVFNLTVGDRFRSYDNTTKEQLYEIAKSADTEKRFDEIEKLSNLWKTELENYRHILNMNIDELLTKLTENGISIRHEFTLRNWLNPDSKVKYPQSIKDMRVLKKTINRPKLDDQFQNILKARRSYNGIMIALGRDLSDEIIDYAINKIKGNNLKKFKDAEIQKLIESNAPIRKILKIEIIKETE